MRLPIPLGSYKRNAAYLPQLYLRNLMLEKTPSTDEGIILMSRPGLAISATVGGNSPIVAIYLSDGLFNGKTIALSGNTFYVGATAVGSLTSPASPLARFAAMNAQLICCNANVLYRTDGIVLSQPVFPGAAGVSAVTAFDGYFIAALTNSARFYWSAVNDATSWPVLNFATAESHPDNLLDVLVINDQLALLGQESIEFWQPNPSGDANLPFTRINGLTYSKGVLNTGAAVYADNTLVWVGNDGIVYRRGSVPQRISDHGIEEQIQEAGSARLFTFNWVGHVLLAIALPNQTLIYDFSTGQWSEFSTYGFLGWRAQCGVANGEVPVFGDSTGPNVLTLSNAAINDAGNIVERHFSAATPDRTIINNISLDAQSGIGSEPNGSAIIIEMRLSRDGGQTFGPWLQSNLGVRGQYRKRAVWRRLGSYDIGAQIEFRTTDDSMFSVQSVRMNEPLSGRAR